MKSTNPPDWYAWQREDAKKLDEWDEQIAAERLAEHEERKDEADDNSGSGNGDHSICAD